MQKMICIPVEQYARILENYDKVLAELEEIKRTGMIHHKKLGTGTVYLVDGETLHIQFESGKIKLNLKTLMKMGLIL